MPGASSRRVIKPELLDSLQVDDPNAIASRRDLVRINRIMFQSVIMARLLRAVLPPGATRLLEIGAGDGSFMLAVARQLGPRWNDVELIMLDQADLLTPARRDEFAALGWRVTSVTADVFAWLRDPNIGAFDAVTANLFLHHFAEADLSLLLSAMPRLAPLFVAAEPRRSKLALWCTGWLRAIGANGVTLHDAAASVRAGFANAELSQLWPSQAGTALQERRIGPFTHAFVAARAMEPPR